MKRIWLLLLSLGLIIAFSASAFAVDVKVSGEFYVGGLYLNKRVFRLCCA
jgi:Skp family chaperone for outer membrane proteins